jgi:hypothetical protein
MMTEHEVRSRLNEIRNAEITPQQKVRRLLKIGRCLSAQAESLRQTGRTTDRNLTAGMSRMASQAYHLSRDVRDEAWGILHGRAFLS